MEWITAYKIFEVRDGTLFNLFFSLSGARRVEFDKVHVAVKKIVSENARSKYLSGIHCVKELELMGDYLKRFSAKRMPHLVVAEVKVRGLRQKPTKGSLALLADEMIVPSGTRQWKALDL